VVRGEDGQQWAFLGVTTDQRCGVFKQDEPLPTPARLAAPIKRNGEQWWHYSGTQRVSRQGAGAGKRFTPEHLAGSRWIGRAGPDPWPFYGKLPATPGAVIELEGEKCVDILLSIGYAAITHPGHNHTPEANQVRYGAIKDRVTHVIYIADNDEPGKRKAAVCQKAAAAAGVPFTILYAEQLWPGIVETGSVDDVEEDAIIPAITAALAKPQPKAVAAGETDLQAFRDEISEHLDTGGSDLQVLITEKSIQHGLTSYQAEAIVRELRKEQDTDAATTASVQQILDERKSLKYRREGIGLNTLLPQSLLGSMRFIMTALPGCDELVAGMVYLGAVSGVLKTGTLIRANYRSFVVPPNMYLAIVGKSGLGKSPTIANIGVRSLDLVRANYRHINAQRFQQWELDNAPLPRREKAPRPKPVMMAIENYTGEYLSELLQLHEEHQLGLLIACDELSAVFKSLNSYKPGGKGTDEQQLLSLFDGRGSASGRVDAGIREFDYAQFSILGGLQPRIFDMLAQGGDPFGLYARMHLLPMDDVDEYRDPVETEETIIQYEAHMRNLQSVALRASLLPPAHYRLSDAAMRELAKVQQAARDLARAAELDEQSSIYGKRAGQIARLAGIVHILRIAAGEIEPDAEIDLVALCNARDIIVHVQQYALAAHARIHSSGDDSWLTQSILKHCTGKKLSASQYRSQYLTRSKHSMYSRQAIENVMQRLADAELLAVVPSSAANARGGIYYQTISTP
jgi:hypothetical protein